MPQIVDFNSRYCNVLEMWGRVGKSGTYLVGTLTQEKTNISIPLNHSLNLSLVSNTALSHSLGYNGSKSRSHAPRVLLGRLYTQKDLLNTDANLLASRNVLDFLEGRVRVSLGESL